MLFTQAKIEEELNTATLDSLPKSLILCGEYGCGRHLLLNRISEKLGVQAKNISGLLKHEYISELYSNPIPEILYIECDDISEKTQNAILKLLEEPPKMAFICILVEDTRKLLGTIVNRCIKWQISPYTRDELSNFTDNEEVLNYARTPGQVLKYSKLDLSGLSELCDKILSCIAKATVPNALSLSSKIEWTNEDTDKYPYKLFVRCLLNSAFKFFVLDDRYFLAYTLAKELCFDMEIPNIDKKKLFENFLVKLKLAVQGEQRSENRGAEVAN